MSTSETKPTLTQRINAMLEEDIDFIRLLKDEKLTVKQRADQSVKTVIKNLGKRKNHPVDEGALDTFKENWKAVKYWNYKFISFIKANVTLIVLENEGMQDVLRPSST
jgi:hypothetical protein